MTQHLFAYGTLMCDDIMLDVCTHSIKGESALLHDFSRRVVTGQPFPALIDSGGDQVQGVLYRNVPEDGWQRLDRFEGVMYARRAVPVLLDSGETVIADAYVIEPEYMGWVEDDLWDYQKFLSKGRKLFEANYAGYDAL